MVVGLVLVSRSSSTSYTAARKVGRLYGSTCPTSRTPLRRIRCGDRSDSRRHPAGRTARPLHRLRRHQGRRSCQRRSLSRRGGRAARPQRRRQVDADQDPVRRLQARRRRDLRQRRAGRHQQSARRQAVRYRNDLPDAGAGRQCRCRRQPLSRPRAAHEMGYARRHRHGSRRRARSWAGSTPTSAASRIR